MAVTFNTPKILVADDEAVIAMELSETLRDMGYEVVGTAYSGAQAVSMAKERRPDLALLDMVMPGEMDGVEAAKRLDKELNIPIVFITAYTNEENLRRLDDCPNQFTIIKPYHEAQVRVSLETALRKKAEEAHKQSEEKYKKLVEQSFHGIAILMGLPPRLVYVNPALCSITGYPEEELLAFSADDIWFLVHEDQREDVKQALFDRLQGTESPQKIEFSVNRKDGSLRIVEAIGDLIDYNGGPALQAVFVDVTERRRYEQVLQKKKAEMSAILQEAPHAMIVVNRELRIRKANRAAAEMTNRRQHELYGLRGGEALRCVHHHDDPKGCGFGPSCQSCTIRLTVMDTLERRTNHQNVEAELLLGEPESTRHFRICAVPLELEGKGNVLVCIEDITERVQIQKEKKDLQIRLHQTGKAECLNRMAGAIAHNFNNHLTVIIGNLDLAIEKVSSSSVQECLVQAKQAARHISEMSLLMLAYLGQTQDSLEPVDLSECCRRNLPSIKAAVPENIRLRTEFMPFGPVVRANGTRMQQILINLATNSWEAIGGKEGTVTLMTKRVPAKNITGILVFPPDWEPQAEVYACLEVRDNGCGISKGDLSKIFDPFFSTKFIGRGMGLASVLGFIRSWGGAIGIESASGKGTTISLFLPEFKG